MDRKNFIGLAKIGCAIARREETWVSGTMNVSTRIFLQNKDLP
jgi:hypothetical protein